MFFPVSTGNSMWHLIMWDFFHLKHKEESDSHQNCKKLSAMTAKKVMYIVGWLEHKVYLKGSGDEMFSCGKAELSLHKDILIQV